MRELRTRSGSVAITTIPSFVSSSGIHLFCSQYSRLRFFSRSRGLMRSDLCGSYSTLKYFASAAPIAAGFTWNSSTRMSSTFLFLRRAAFVARSSSPAWMMLSMTRYSNLEAICPGICWRTRKAIASVLASSITPSSCSELNGWPDRLLMSCRTPMSSVPESPPRIGAMSICLER